jgi:signal transduction histidine kinase
MSRIALHAISLRSRVYLLMGTGIFFPTVLMAAVGLYWLRSLDERIIAGRLSAAGAIAAHFDGELTEDLEVLQRLASTAAPAFQVSNAAEKQRAVREAHHSFRRRETVYLLDASHRVLAQEPPGPAPSVVRGGIPLLDDVVRTGLPRLSGLVDDARGPTVHELVPVRSWQGTIVGVAGGTFDPAKRDFAPMLAHLRRGQTGTADLVDAAGMVIASTAPGRAGRPSDCRENLGGMIREKRRVSVRCAECHAERGVAASAAPELLTLVPLAAAPWAVVVRQSVREALPTEGAVPWQAAVGVLFAQLALAGAFAWGAARSVTQPVAVLTNEAERIAGGELAWPIPELGADEVGRLGGSLERMRQSLRDLIAHVEQVNAELEGRVAARTRELNEANALLREREEARSQLLRKVITAQEDERKRIARELHDETSQGLAVLAMGLEAAQDALRGGRTPRLDEVKAVAVRTLEDVHRLIFDLRPSVLDDLGLLSAIRWYADRHLGSRGIAVRCEFGELDRRLPPELETAVFRMCQETMSNVARHAQASAVLIQVGIEGDWLSVEIEDDGRGFDPEAAARREGRRPWGLLGIRERAEILGGVARIDSSPGQGTRVWVRVPVPKDAAPAGTPVAGGVVP